MIPPTAPPTPSETKPKAAPSPRQPQPKKRNETLRYAVWAAAFLIFGMAGGGGYVVISKGMLSVSTPPVVRTVPTTISPGSSPVAPTKAETGATANAAGTKVRIEETDLVEPADPFFDMEQSAVIPLAGDPVFLGKENRKASQVLTARQIDAGSLSADSGTAIRSDTAYVLDDSMLDKDGNLAARAPGSEADFRFGNFSGGGSDSGSAQSPGSADTSAAASGSAHPAAHAMAGMLNIYMTERPIGLGPSRLEVSVSVSKPQTVSQALVENGFDKDVADNIDAFMKSTYGLGGLTAGDKFAARGIRMANRVGQTGDHYRPVQVSVYGKNGYIGTAALSSQRGTPQYIAGADPWFGKAVGNDNQASQPKPAEVAGKTYRLIDGLYATAVRNAVPSSIVGEAISYLAAMTDLQKPIKPNERFTLIFVENPRDPTRGGGRVLFAGLRQNGNWELRCYVLKAPGNRGFACVNEGGEVNLSGSMFVPVKGVLTSKFGFRSHPILGVERLHAGVDWAAPAGTPIHAAFSGKITYRDVRGGYGNSIEITHAAGITSRYAHMQAFADGLAVGSPVQAGDLIGYIGTTGLSTGPHLHFEIRRNAEPIDPLAFKMEGGGEAPQSVASSALGNYRAGIERILTGY